MQTPCKSLKQGYLIEMKQVSSKNISLNKGPEYEKVLHVL